jgi:hypothetical protein
MLGQSTLVQGNTVAFVKKEELIISLRFCGGGGLSFTCANNEEAQYNFDIFTSSLKRHCIVINAETLVNPDFVEACYYGSSKGATAMTFQCKGCAPLVIKFAEDISKEKARRLFNACTKKLIDAKTAPLFLLKPSPPE